MENDEEERKLLAAVDAYLEDHRHPGRPKFMIHERRTLGSPEIKGSWEGTPESYKAGCYAIFSQEGTLLYVGKASHGKSMGSRVVRFRYKPNDWSIVPAFVRMIEVTEAFEAPSLEEFLIQKLKPPFNKVGIL